MVVDDPKLVRQDGRLVSPGSSTQVPSTGRTVSDSGRPPVVPTTSAHLGPPWSTGPRRTQEVYGKEGPLTVPERLI